MSIKIGFAWPHTSPFYHKAFTESAFCMARPVGQYQLLLPNGDGPVDAIRNELCQQALLTKCTHVFWCDTDQKYPVDTLTRLFEHQLPIVCAKVHRRKAPYDALLYRLNPDKEDREHPHIAVSDDEWAFDLKDNPQYPLVEVDATGFGCNLMSIDVIESMERPWFQFDLYKKPTIGEDIYFWNKAKVLGFRIYVDVSIDIGHISSAVVNGATYFEYKRQQGLG